MSDVYKTKSFNPNDRLVKMINQMQEQLNLVGNSLSIKLPRIAVVGNQSSGKTSVLERIMCMDLLPKGSGTVTKRPIIIEMYNTTRDQVTINVGGVDYTDEKEARSKIELLNKEEGEKHSENKFFITKKPLTVKIYSPNVLTITLIDLPGLIINPDKSIGQDDNLVKDIDELVRGFIDDSMCLILAVASLGGAADLTSSKAFNMARTVDPSGERTIGILTHLDMIGEGHDALDFLIGRSHKLARGYFGLVNRSQADITSGQDIQKPENDFLKSNKGSIYKKASVTNRMGVKNLIASLYDQFHEHIRKNFIVIRENVEKEISQLKKSEDFTENDDDENKEKEDTKNEDILHRIIQELAELSRKGVFGISHDDSLDSDRISEAVRLKDIFKTELPKSTPPSDTQLETLIKNSNGIHASIFPNTSVLRALVKEQHNFDRLFHYIEGVLTQTKQCLDNVLTNLCDNPKLQKYQRLHDHTLHLLKKQLESYRESCLMQLKIFIEMQICYLNIDHPDFDMVKAQEQALKMTRKSNRKPVKEAVDEALDEVEDNSKDSEKDDGVKNDDIKTVIKTISVGADTASVIAPSPITIGAAAVAKVVDGLATPISNIFGDKETKASVSSKVPKEINNMELNKNIVRNLAERYLDIIDKNVIDIVPKAIYYHIIINQYDFIRFELIKLLKDNVKALMSESQEVVQKRKSNRKQLKLLYGVLKIIDDYTISSPESDDNTTDSDNESFY